VDLEAAAALLHRAERPLLYVGQGAVISGAGKAVTQLAEKLPILNFVDHGASVSLMSEGGMSEAGMSDAGGRLSELAT
jgi:thiamine pyrophosphate-dependent acetolactate synthase large subunit-like protein